jgi:hypothetical protein
VRFFQVCLQSDSGSSLCELEIERTADATSTTLQHMGIQHRCADIFVSKQFLDRADVIAIFQEMGRKTMAERMTTAALLNAGALESVFDGLLQHTF